MALRFRTLLAATLIVALAGALALPADAQETVWTAVIPQGFPGNVYTWRLKPDGSYAEDGRDRRTGAAVQSPLSGHWRMTGRHMVLHQDGIDYVFDGEIMGDEYLGTVLSGRQALLALLCRTGNEAAPDLRRHVRLNTS